MSVRARRSRRTRRARAAAPRERTAHRDFVRAHVAFQNRVVILPSAERAQVGERFVLQVRCELPAQAVLASPRNAVELGRGLQLLPPIAQQIAADRLGFIGRGRENPAVADAGRVAPRGAQCRHGSTARTGLARCTRSAAKASQRSSSKSRALSTSNRRLLGD